MNKKRRILKWALNSWILHLLFWALSVYILLHLFSDSSEVERIDWIYTVIFIVTLLIPSLLNLYLLMPYLLNHKRYFIYGASVLALVLSGSLMNHVLFDQWIDHILPGYYFISYYDYWDIVKFFIVFIGVTTLLKLSKEWFTLSEAKQQLSILEKAKVEAELNALKSQINPHFLFNSLNVLYSLVRKKAKEAPEAIIMLSDILRYVLYEANNESVSLQQEINLIKDYIDLQGFRLKPDVQFNIDADDEETRIIPMILLPLVENAYKHGGKSKSGELLIAIDLFCKDKHLKFHLTNSLSQKQSSSMGNHSGIGLENITKRLDHYYGEKYHLHFTEEDRQYTVKLNIDLI